MIRYSGLHKVIVGVAIVLCMGIVTKPAVASDPGVTKNEIIIGGILPLQSPLSAGATQVRAGADAYYKYVNDNGGIHGRKIKWIVENDSYNPQQTVAVAKKLVDRDGIFAVVTTLGTATTLAALPFLVERDIPLIGPLGGHAKLTKPKDRVVFALNLDGADYGEVMAEYSIKKLKAKRVGIFYQNDPWGKDPRDGVVKALARQNMKPVAEAGYMVNDSDVSAQAILLKNAEPDVVIMAGIIKHGVMFLKEAQKLGWKTYFLSNSNLADPIMPGLTGTALEGVLIAYSGTLETSPRAQKYNEILAKYYPNQRPGGYAYAGMGPAIIFCEAVKRAGPDLTREKLITTLESMKGFDPVIFPPLTWVKGNHDSPVKWGYAVWKNGQLQPMEE